MIDDRDRPIASKLRLDIVSDAICPWCYIGKVHLESAFALLGADAKEFAVAWQPFQLNPDMPREGVERRAYRIAKFGSPERAAELDARVTSAAAAAGLDFHLDHIVRTPNTVLAHRLIRRAGALGHQDAVVEAVFRAYFVAGQDIGDRQVLTGAAADAGLDPSEAGAFLAGAEEEAAVLAEDTAARRSGVNGVPSFFVGGHLLCSGALPAEQLAAGLRRARDILRRQEPAAA